MQREFSAGGIVFNDKGQVLIVQHSANLHWGFPKGHIGKGQTSKEAATREVNEEGGIEAEIIDKLGESKYIYMNQQKQRVFKVVIIYLMKYISGDIKDHDWEISDLGWFDPEQAVKRLDFSNDKLLLKKALKLSHR